VECIAYQQLIQKIIHHINDQEKFLFILEVNKSFIGFEVEFSRKLNAQLSRFKKTKFKIEHASNVIKNKLNVMKFNRISILDARNSFIYTRNNKEKKDFRGLKIALIGCGAIGSFVAKQLAASGAGLSSIKQGELYLYDDDILQPGNLGRHALGIEYLLKNKAIATKEHINKNNSQLIIHALSRKFNESDFNNNFDFVIDCTAKETSSTVISKWFISSGKKITKVCHGWIDAYGDAARSLIYDSNGPCYSCLNIYSDNVIIPRFPLFNKEKSNNIEYFGNNCGSTYMYYDSSACLMASSLIIRNIYNYLNGNSENFLHVGLTNEIKKTNNKILKKINGCPLCQ
jgi:molybdopterin/thiamine biosynthesis adenylyltransferase